MNANFIGFTKSQMIETINDDGTKETTTVDFSHYHIVSETIYVPIVPDNYKNQTEELDQCSGTPAWTFAPFVYIFDLNVTIFHSLYEGIEFFDDRLEMREFLLRGLFFAWHRIAREQIEILVCSVCQP